MTVFYYRDKKNRLYCAIHATDGMTAVTTSTYPEECCKCLKIRMTLMLKHRNTTCSGCYNNRYNFESSGDARNAPTSGTGCWSLVHIQRNVCKARR